MSTPAVLVEALVLDRDRGLLHVGRDLVGVDQDALVVVEQRPDLVALVVEYDSRSWPRRTPSCSRAGAGPARSPSSSRRRSRRSPSSPRPARMISRRSFLIRPGFGLRGRRELIRRGQPRGGGLPSPSAEPGRGLRQAGRDAFPQRLNAVAPLGDSLAADPLAGSRRRPRNRIPDRRAPARRRRSSAAVARAPTRSPRPQPPRPRARAAPAPASQIEDRARGDARPAGGPPWRSCGPRPESGGPARTVVAAREAASGRRGVKSSSPRLSQSPLSRARPVGELRCRPGGRWRRPPFPFPLRPATRQRPLLPVARAVSSLVAIDAWGSRSPRAPGAVRPGLPRVPARGPLSAMPIGPGPHRSRNRSRLSCRVRRRWWVGPRPGPASPVCESRDAHGPTRPARRKAGV